MERSFWQEEQKAAPFDPDRYLKLRQRQIEEEERELFARKQAELCAPASLTSQPRFDPSDPHADWAGVVPPQHRRAHVRGALASQQVRDWCRCSFGQRVIV